MHILIQLAWEFSIAMLDAKTVSAAGQEKDFWFVGKNAKLFLVTLPRRAPVRKRVKVSKL